jgi:hypothetical protein
MRLLALFSPIIVAVNAYYTLSVYAPSLPQIHARIINARNKAFIIGATKPSTFCGLDNATECPDGTSTQVDGNMTGLAVGHIATHLIHAHDIRPQFQAVNSSSSPPMGSYPIHPHTPPFDPRAHKWAVSNAHMSSQSARCLSRYLCGPRRTQVRGFGLALQRGMSRLRRRRFSRRRRVLLQEVAV